MWVLCPLSLPIPLFYLLPVFYVQRTGCLALLVIWWTMLLYTWAARRQVQKLLYEKHVVSVNVVQWRVTLPSPLGLIPHPPPFNGAAPQQWHHCLLFSLTFGPLCKVHRALWSCVVQVQGQLTCRNRANVYVWTMHIFFFLLKIKVCMSVLQWQI